MTSKEKILSHIRQSRPAEPVALPENIGFDPVAADLTAAFGEMLRSGGGSFVPVNKQEEAEAYLQRNYSGFKTVVNLVGGLIAGTLAVETVTDPHALAPVDLAILPARFGVAENGAVWLEEADMGGHRVLPFITQHLVIVLDKNNLVANLHQAYQRIDLSQTGFGLFLAGPSKTADIEQSLVIGAHGARSLTVLAF